MFLQKTITGLFLSVFMVGFAFAQADNQNVDQIIKQLGQKIEKVTPVVEKSGNPEAIATLAKGVDKYNKGIELNTAGKPREALKELNIAARLVLKAYALATNQTSIDVVLKRLAAYIERVKIIVDKSANKEAAAVLARGVEHFDLAVKLASENKVREAFVEVKISSKLVAKAEAIAKAQLALNVKIERLGKRIDVVKVLVDKSTNPEAKKVFDLGNEHYTKAVDLNTNGKVREAVVELTVAAKLIERAAVLAKI